MEREIWEIVKALDDKKLTAIEAHTKLCDYILLGAGFISIEEDQPKSQQREFIT